MGRRDADCRRAPSETRGAADWRVCRCEAVAPAASDLCTVDGDDSNCNDAPNDSCDCVLGESESCGTIYGSLGVCAQTSLSCRASGTWPAASSCAATSAEVCNASGRDEDCDGDVDEGCNCHDPSPNNLLDNPGFDLPGQTTDWSSPSIGVGFFDKIFLSTGSAGFWPEFEVRSGVASEGALRRRRAESHR